MIHFTFCVTVTNAQSHTGFNGIFLLFATPTSSFLYCSLDVSSLGLDKLAMVQQQTDKVTYPDWKVVSEICPHCPIPHPRRPPAT